MQTAFSYDGPSPQLLLSVQALAPSNPCKTGFGVGVVGGADAGAGAGPGAFATGSGGGAVLFNGFHLPNLAGFLTGGLGAGSHGHPSQSNGSVTALGAGAAAGGGLFFTNATNASQLNGPALTFSGGVDVGVGLGISISIGTDAAGNTIWTGTVTGGVGLKVYGYAGTTQTKAGGTGPKC